MSYKKMLVVILCIVIFMFGLMLTTSYAWYSFSAGSTTFSAVTSNKDIEVNFFKGEYINNTVAVPIANNSNAIDQYSDKHQFFVNVKNSPENNEIMVRVSLADIAIDNSLRVSEFKVELYYQGSRLGNAVAGNQLAVSGATTKELGSVVLSNELTNNFEVRVYLLDNGKDQSSLMNKHFQAKIQVDVISRLKTNLTDLEPDIYVSSITIDGNASDHLPTKGLYTMTSNCNKGSNLSWDAYNKILTYEPGSKVGDLCSLEFTSDNNYPLLNTMEVGSYVAYVGSGGTVGSKSVACQKNGSASSSTASAETEAPNSCLGQNAREDLDTSGYTHGYCYISYLKYVTTGWRIAYIDQTDASNPKAILVSAGSPECNSRVSSTGNVTYIQTANAKALKYCNQDYVDGNCSCTDSDADGLCDSPSTDAWAINDTDFYYMTKAISGYGKRLTSSSSSLGDSGGSLGTTLYCNNYYSRKECGYNNDLIDNGGYYWFAARYSPSSTYGVNWGPGNRSVNNDNGTDAYGGRPVIRLSSSVYVTGGSGTMDDPYTIGN